MSKETKFTTPVEPPLVLSDPDKSTWREIADIVIVGFGGTAAAAGLQARERGASVIAVDRFDGGGATAYSGGIHYAAGTRYQREAGFDDNAEEMYKYLSAEGMAVSDATIRRFSETSNANMEWVTGYGVQYGSTFYPGRTSYPPDGYYLYYSGMEKFRPDVARAAPRGHRPVGKGPSGRYYWAAMRKAALEHGVQLIPHSPVRRLVQNSAGKVIGVEVQVIPESAWRHHRNLYKRVNPYKPFGGVAAEKAIAECRLFEAGLPQERALIRARRGVIIAAGSYTYNLEILKRHLPTFAAAYPVLVRGGSMGCDGSGLELGLSVGGVTDQMDAAIIVRPLSPPTEFVRGLLVNLEGERIINEDAYLGNIGQAVASQSGGGAAWLILDSTTFWRGFRQLLPPKMLFSWYGMPAMVNLLLGGTHRARTPSALAVKCGINPAALAQTLAAYNASSARQADPLGKQRENLGVLDKPSFYAVNLSLGNKFGFAGGMPFGGLKVNEITGAVLRENGQPIPGLYAGGRSALGLPPVGRSSPKTTFSGLSIADTIYSGRRAAISLTQQQESPAEHRPLDIHAMG